MAGTEVTQQSPAHLIRANKIQVMVDEEAPEEVVPEEAVAKDVAEEADASTVQHTQHRSETSRETRRILARF